jgi:hypothetical protein
MNGFTLWRPFGHIKIDKSVIAGESADVGLVPCLATTATRFSGKSE